MQTQDRETWIAAMLCDCTRETDRILAWLPAIPGFAVVRFSPLVHSPGQFHEIGHELLLLKLHLLTIHLWVV
jgi:hypothetical protein